MGTLKHKAQDVVEEKPDVLVIGGLVLVAVAMLYLIAQIIRWLVQ